MSLKSAFCFLSCCIFTVSLSSIIHQAKAQQQVRFICANGLNPQDNKFYPTTYALTDRGKIPVIRWKYYWFGDNDIVLKGRCQTVSSTFQAAYDHGNFNYITNARSGGQPVICATGRFFGPCATLFLALRSSNNSVRVLTELKQALEGYSVSLPLPRHTSDSQGYFSVDLNQFLATAPVEQ